MAGKIAITATGNSTDSDVDQRFGRARYLLIADLESGEWSVIDNTADHGAAHGAGIQTAQLLINHGVNSIVSGDCGPKATQLLQAAGISVHTGFSGSVTEALDKFNEKQKTKTGGCHG